MTWAGQASESGFLTYDDGRLFWTDADSLGSASSIPRTEVVTSGIVVNLDTDTRRVVIRKAIGSPTIINLPSSPFLGQEVVIKDGKGDATSNPIMVVALSGLLIDGFPEIRMANNYQSTTLLCDGIGWNIL